VCRGQPSLNSTCSARALPDWSTGLGLAFLIANFKTLAVTRRAESYNRTVRFWSRIFAVSVIMGVVTGIPLEFQFGTNWARFSAQTGSIIAQLLAMEGAFAFFLPARAAGRSSCGTWDRWPACTRSPRRAAS
jgi:cytochrome bd-type quinol oxidase subunit 1